LFLIHPPISASTEWAILFYFDRKRIRLNDFKKMMTTAIEKSLGQDGTSTKRRSFLQVESKLKRFLGGLLNPNAIREVVTKTASTLFSQPELVVDRNNLCKVADEIGWRPAETFETGIRRTVRWYLDHAGWVEGVLSGRYQDWVQSNYADRDTPAS
jgi:hypothetical protein